MSEATTLVVTFSTFCQDGSADFGMYEVLI